jgi:hypothetical protein
VYVRQEGAENPADNIWLQGLRLGYQALMGDNIQQQYYRVVSSNMQMLNLGWPFPFPPKIKFASVRQEDSENSADIPLSAWLVQVQIRAKRDQAGISRTNG